MAEHQNVLSRGVLTELASVRAALVSCERELAALRGERDALAASADEAWGLLLAPDGRADNLNASLAKTLQEVQAQLALETARADAATAKLGTEPLLEAQRRAAHAEASAAAASDGLAVLQFVAAQELRRTKESFAAEKAALLAELTRARDALAAHSTQPDGAAETLWQLVEQQDAALKELLAHVTPSGKE